MPRLPISDVGRTWAAHPLREEGLRRSRRAVDACDERKRRWRLLADAADRAVWQTLDENPACPVRSSPGGRSHLT